MHALVLVSFVQTYSVPLPPNTNQFDALRYIYGLALS